MKIGKLALSISILFFLFFDGVYAKSKEEKLREKLRQLQEKKQKIRQKQEKEIEKNLVNKGEDRRKSIELFEKIVNNPNTPKAKKADAIFTLAKLYYEEDAMEFKKASEEHAKYLDSPNPPPAPLPDYSRSINFFNRLLSEYPEFDRREEALFRLGNLYTIIGENRKSQKPYLILVKEYPNTRNLGIVALRIGENYFFERENRKALEWYKKATDHLGLGDQNYLLALFRVGNCYYNLGDFDQAVAYFFKYVEEVDNGNYPKSGLREEAIEYLAISFSEYEKGAQKALKFFEKKGGRGYQDTVIYTVGVKNRAHDKNAEAIFALEFLLDNYPLYVDAPNAIRLLIESYIVERNYDEANNWRIRMVTEYHENSRWADVNDAAKYKMAENKKIIKESYSEIPMYFHDKGRANKKAERQTDPEMLTKAVEWYRKYNNRYSDEKWRVYKNRYLIAECYYEMRRYREAATEFDWLATVDLGTYPPREKEKKLTHEKGQPSDTSKTEEAMITQEECGYNAVFCYRKLSEIAVAKSGLDQKESFSLPEVKAYLAYVDKFARLFPDSKHVPAFLYASAVTLFTAEQWPQAAGRFENIMQEYPDASTEEGSLAKRAERMLAKSQVQMGNFAEAVGTFKSALSKLEKDTELYAEVKKSVEGAMFKEAEQLRSQGRYVESANTFLAILRDYPDSDIGDKILFEAAASFEQGSKFKEAAVTFEQVMTRYKESGLAIRALLRSADAYKKLRDFISAAKMFEKVTKSFPQDKEAVPSLFRAATAYDSAGEMILAARTLESVAAKYPKSSEAPGALYTAGLKYEKGEMYKDAINVYEKLRKDFQNSNYTIEAVFSVALNYENLKDDKGIAKAYENFIEFSENSGETDFNKLSSSCIKAAKAYLRLGNTRRAELMYNKAIGIYKEYGKKHLIDPAFPAEAHFYFADQYYEDYADIKLAGRSSKTVARQMKKKLKAIEKPIKEYAAIISLQTDKYTTKATFMCGKIFYNLADAIKHQSVNEKNPFKKAYAQMKINETVPQYLAKGQEYFYTNIHKFGIEMGVNDEWVKKSGELFMQGEYLKGYLFEESAEIIDAAPIPKGMSAEEKEAYKYEIEDIVLQLQDKAVPAYEVGLKNAKDLFLRDSQYEYTAKIRKRLAALRPANEALQIVIGAKPTPTKEKSTKDRMDINLKRALAAIEEIVNSSELSFSDKREKLNAIERTARGNMERERIKIKNLKEEIESVQNKIEEILK